MYGPPNTGADLRAWLRWLAPHFGGAKKFKIVKIIAKVNANILDRYLIATSTL